MSACLHFIEEDVRLHESVNQNGCRGARRRHSRTSSGYATLKIIQNPYNHALARPRLLELRQEVLVVYKHDLPAVRVGGRHDLGALRSHPTCSSSCSAWLEGPRGVGNSGRPPSAVTCTAIQQTLKCTLTEQHRAC
jgi:hypothetical protein